MDGIDIIDRNVLESRSLKIVEIIKKNRNKPCYQNIFTFLIRGSLTMD